MLPETQAKAPSVTTIIADVPAAKPSIPSVKLAPFEIAVTIKTTININRTQYLCRQFLIKVNLKFDHPWLSFLLAPRSSVDESLPA